VAYENLGIKARAASGAVAGIGGSMLAFRHPYSAIDWPIVVLIGTTAAFSLFLIGYRIKTEIERRRGDE
jgi:hypothetical protein